MAVGVKSLDGAPLSSWACTSSSARFQVYSEPLNRFLAKQETVGPHLPSDNGIVVWAIYVGALHDGQPHQVNVSIDVLHFLPERFTEGGSRELVECKELTMKVNTGYIHRARPTHSL